MTDQEIGTLLHIGLLNSTQNERARVKRTEEEIEEMRGDTLKYSRAD